MYVPFKFTCGNPNASVMEFGKVGPLGGPEGRERDQCPYRRHAEQSDPSECEEQQQEAIYDLEMGPYYTPNLLAPSP